MRRRRADTARRPLSLGSRRLATKEALSRRVLAEVAIEVRSDDPSLEAELALILGTRTVGSRCRVGVHLESDPVRPGGALATFETDDEAALTVEDLLLALETVDFPFRLVAPTEAEWTSFAWLSETEPLFSFRGRSCRIQKRPGWQRAFALLILHRVFRLRPDAIFFHAATVGIGGRGILIVGPKGRGKSTLSLALASRGHVLLGDETGCYVPASRELCPVLRPVGIKPGPRARAVDAALGSCAEGVAFLRIEADRLFPGRPEPHRLPLFAIVFLEPFASRPGLDEIAASTEDIARLQPVSSSLVNAPRAQRVFELGRMLSFARVFRLAPGGPDETAALVEGTFGGFPP